LPSRCIWSLLVGIAIVGDGTALLVRLGWPGVIIGDGIAVGSAEFLCPNEERRWAFAGAAIPVHCAHWEPAPHGEPVD
jgi:hypothetical protein